VADVVLGSESYDTEVRFNGESATFIGIYVLPTANSLDVIDGIKRALPEVVAGLPAGLRLTIPYDSTAYIHNAIDEVVNTLVEALAIVVVVIFLFLGSVRSVVIPIVAMPLSLVGGCFIMLAMGFTINLLTLLALVLAVGLVVDDAIVVVKNIHRHMEDGMPRLEAALKGARELGGPVVAMTVTLAAVYAPIGFEGGLTGTLFREFAFTLVGAVVISGIVALTLSPMMCSRLLRHDPDKKGFAHFLDTTFDRMRGRYERMLSSLMATWPVMLAVPAVALALIVPFYALTKQELAPNEDQGIIIARSFGSPNANVDQTTYYGEQVHRVFRSYPETMNVFQVFGAISSSAASGVANAAIGGMVLKPWGERTRGTVDLLPDVTRKLGTVTGFKTLAFLRPPLPGGGSGAPVQFVVLSTDTPVRMAQVADEMVSRSMASGLFTYADSDLKLDQARGDLEIDRDKAAELGVNMQEVANDVGSLLGGAYVNFFNIQGNSYKVIPLVERARRLNTGQLDDYYVGTKSGRLVALSTFARVRTDVQPQSLNHFQQLNSATISLVMRPGVTQSDALAYLRFEAARVFPHGYTMDYGGQSRQFVQEGSSLIVAFAFGAIIIFLVLAAQFESFRDPLVILLGSVPMTLVGALAFLFLGASTINIYTQVGFITLVGLISKHGILITQFANQLQSEGMGKLEAIEHAAGVRLRPILMTTAAMVLGVVPLVVATGAGAASRYAMGIVIVTGMTVGTFFTLFVVPSVYMLIGSDRSKAEAPPP
jgi:multidrug efflux pump